MSALGKLRHSIESLRERQYWAVLDGHPAGQPMIAAIDLMAAKSPVSPFVKETRMTAFAAVHIW
jgi:hypothetical protein